MEGKAYYFTADLSKRELYTGEQAVLTVSFYRHRDINTVLGRFKPHSHDAITYEEFQVESESRGEYDIEHYVYLVSFKKAGRFTLPVRAEARKYNEQDLIDSSNHRDAMNVAAASVEQVDVGSFAVTVLPGDGADAVGEFTLRVIPDEPSVLVNEPAHFTLTLEGEGDINALSFPKVEIEGAKVFLQEGERTRWLEAGRIKGRKSNQYAVVAAGDFVIPAFSIRYFSPRSGAVQSVSSSACTVTVKSDPVFAEKSLLDSDEEIREEPEFTPETLMRWGLYGLLFLSGYLAARIRIRLPGRKREPAWIREIAETDDQKELLARLLPHIDHPACHEFIVRLESGPMERSEVVKLKRELLKTLKSYKKSLG